jgi:hypothetical protein
MAQDKLLLLERLSNLLPSKPIPQLARAFDRFR